MLCWNKNLLKIRFEYLVLRVMQSRHDLDQLIVDRILYLVVLHQFREMSRQFSDHALLCKASSGRPNLVPNSIDHD